MGGSQGGRWGVREWDWDPPVEGFIVWWALGGGWSLYDGGKCFGKKQLQRRVRWDAGFVWDPGHSLGDRGVEARRCS